MKLTKFQIHRANEIINFVKIALKHIPNKTKRGVFEMEAKCIIQASLYRESNKHVVEYCTIHFKKQYGNNII